MSEPTRYRVANNQAQLTLGGGILAVDPAGPLVEYTDYARLKAEVERIRKAGDELERVLTNRCGSYEAGNASHEWQSAKNAAKEGKQS